MLARTSDRLIMVGPSAATIRFLLDNEGASR
jgi:hypothetical protein